MKMHAKGDAEDVYHVISSFLEILDWDASYSKLHSRAPVERDWTEIQPRT